MPYDYCISLYPYTLTTVTTGTPTVLVSSTTTAVVGSPGYFLVNVKVGWILKVNSEFRRIVSVIDDNNLTVETPFAADFEQVGSYGVIPFYNLETELGLAAPKSTFRPYSQAQKLGDATIRGGGWPLAEWQWGFMRRANRDSLRAFCTGASRQVIIRTRQNDSADAYANYRAVMVWPEEEKRDAGRRIEFVVKFQALSVYIFS